MAFNGSGLFQRLYNWVNDAGAGIDISAMKMDAEENGFAAGLSNCITKDGQQTLTADIPWAGFKITGLGDAANPQDAVNLRTLQSVAPVFVASSGVGGTANAITLTGTIAAYAAGQRFSFPAGATNTSGTVTININGLGTKSIRKTIGGSIVALGVGDIPGSRILDIEYDGTQFQIMNLRPYSQGADIASATTIILDTATGDYVHVTGATTITTITLAQGRQMTVEFAGVLTLTNGASLLCLSAADITTAAGDCAVFRGEASGVVRMVSYQAASGKPIVTPSIDVAHGGTGQSALTLNNVILGNGTGAVKFVAPGTSGNVLTSDGTIWSSQAASTFTATSGIIVLESQTIQYGLYNGGVNAPTITFPIAFSSNPFVFQSLADASGTAVLEQSSLSTSSVVITQRNSASGTGTSNSFNWLAIGPT